MAKESMKARERKRAKMVAKYAAKRKALKEAGELNVQCRDRIAFFGPLRVRLFGVLYSPLD